MLRVDLLSTRVSNGKVRQKVNGYFLMNEDGKVTMHKMTDHFKKDIEERGINTIHAAKPVKIYLRDGEAFMDGLRYQFSGSYLRATMPYTTEIKRSEITIILDSIRSYAKAYDILETLQERYSHFMPSGDQKTGVIGEFYSMLYLQRTYPKSSISLGNAAQKGWDIEVSQSKGRSKYIQVKTVSGFSKTRRISPIHHGWDKLFLMYLDKKLFPIGFWIVDDSAMVKSDEELIGKTMPIPGKENTGSAAFKNRIDQLSELLEAFK